MGIRLKSNWIGSVRIGVRRTLVHALVLLLACGPLSPAARASQSGAFGGAADSSNAAANISKMMSVLSMALGGLYMAKGAHQLTCCALGCNGSGAESRNAKDKLDRDAKDKGSEITTKPILFRALPDANPRYPDSVKNDFCPSFQAPSSGLFSLFHFFQPPKAVAAIGGCLDAMIALITGGLMLMNGIMGMKAANQAGQHAASSGTNMTGMNSYPGGIGTSLDSAGAAPERGSSSIGSSGQSGELVKIDPSLLHTGTANDIMSQFEKKFGIGRDKFANSVANGEDPRKILGSAPLNPLSNADMNKATNGAKAWSADEKANALAGTALSNAEKELLGKLGTGQGKDEFAVNAGSSGASRSPSGLRPRQTDEDEELDGVVNAEGPAAAEGLGLSPEVQAALTAKELDDRANGITSLSIFEVVHLKYREKSKMIFGYDPDGLRKGVNGGKGN